MLVLSEAYRIQSVRCRFVRICMGKKLEVFGSQASEQEVNNLKRLDEAV